MEARKMENEIRWDRAKGSKVKINGKWYIDFTSSIFSQNFGHNNPYMLREVRKQLRKCSHAYGYSTEIKEKFLSELKIYFPAETRFLLFSTGAEANVAVIKIAIKNGYIPTGLRGAMHGRTTGTEALVGKSNSHIIENYPGAGFPNIFGARKRAYFIEGYRGYDCRVLTEANIETIRGVFAEGAEN
jgi:4-aminobutyrate aminotransferase-like enzyme